jgi:hypothetical protein
LAALFAWALEADNRSLDNLDEGDAKDFGHCLAMESIGHGVSWFDNHAKFPLHLPYFEFSLEDPETNKEPEVSPDEEVTLNKNMAEAIASLAFRICSEVALGCALDKDPAEALMVIEHLIADNPTSRGLSNNAIFVPTFALLRTLRHIENKVCGTCGLIRTIKEEELTSREAAETLHWIEGVLKEMAKVKPLSAVYK